MLSALQIKTLAIEARKAWEALSGEERRAVIDQASAALNDPFGVSAAKAFDWWRHQQQSEVTGKASLRDMCNEDFNLLKSRWLYLQGNVKGSLHADIAATEEDARQLRWLIQQASQEHGLAWPGYAETVCRSKCGKALEHADASILQQVLYTINNRGRHSSRRKSAKPKIGKNGNSAPRGFFATPAPAPAQVVTMERDGTRHTIEIPF